MSPTTARRVRPVVAVVALVLAVAVIPVVVAGLRSPDRRLDPTDSSLAGSQALAEVLGRHGVTVQRLDDPDAVPRDDLQDTLLLVSDPLSLAPDDARSLAALPVDRLVVGADVAGHLVGRATVSGSAVPRSREPGCDLDAADRAGSAYLGGVTFSTGNGVTGCYRSDGAATMVRFEQGGRTVTVVGDGTFMTNQRVDEDGNAALAVNLAGSQPRLLWLVRAAEQRAAGAGGASLSELVPTRVFWVVAQLAVAVVLVALWRGRRLGPVVTERLPVVVRAAETVEGRGRLYRSRRARDRAALALRSASSDRLSRLLGLSSAASAEATVSAVVGRVGGDAAAVHALLYGAPPTDDDGLVRLADGLDALEREVHDS
ncbi:MAG: DUF4350 domain-containing protein [Propionibacteriales bacterium]|nr:DUF4350 domain-containing protein [Propionibacteriales bacterium]